MGKRVKEKKHYHKNFNSFRQNDLDTAHVSFFFRGFFETYFTPSIFRKLCESSTEYGHENAFQNVACGLASEGYIIFVWILQ